MLAGCILSSLAALAGGLLLITMIRAILNAEFDLPWNTKTGWSWFAILWGVIADGMIFLIAAILWLTTSYITSFEVTVHENGLSIHDSHGVRDIPWRDVIALVDVDVGERMPILHFPANLLLPRWYSIRHELWTKGESEPQCFDKNSISDISEFGAMLHDACREHRIPVTRRVEHDT
jgi:hypothetical protein